MSGCYLRIAVVHYVAVSGASRDRVLLAAAREPQDHVAVAVARPAHGLDLPRQMIDDERNQSANLATYYMRLG